MAWNSGNKRTFPVVNNCRIAQLSPEMTGVKIVGLVIAKSPIRENIPSNSMSSGETTMKSVFTFTIRDSVKDFINVTCWASQMNGPKITSSFHIGDVVQILNASVHQKVEGSFADRCLVQTPVPIMLSINDRTNSVERYSGLDMQQYYTLKSELIIPGPEHMNLTQVMQYANAKLKLNTNKEYLSFFAGVKFVGDVREVVTKRNVEREGDGKTIPRLQLSLFDEFCGNFPLVIWDDENIRLATKWIPKKTILSFVNCHVKYDTYRSGFIGTIDSQTVIIVNPNVTDIYRLRIFMESYALSHPTYEGSDGVTLGLAAANSIPGCGNESIPLTSIHQLSTVVNLMENKIENQYGIIYGLLSRFDIDSDNISMFTMRRCLQCRRKVSTNPLMCVNGECPRNGRVLNHVDNTHLDFHVAINICDHTGTATSCYFGGTAMEEFLGRTPQQFLQITRRERAKIKYQFFMRRLKFYFKSSLTLFNKSSPMIKILGIQEPIFHEVIEALKWFNQNRTGNKH